EARSIRDRRRRALLARNPLVLSFPTSARRQDEPEQRDGSRVPTEILGADLVERVRRSVMHVEVAATVGEETGCGSTAADARGEVGAEGTVAKATNAEAAERGEKRHHGRHRLRTAADADRVRRTHAVVGLERGDVALVVVPAMIILGARNLVL